jgi:hypothetical protein
MSVELPPEFQDGTVCTVDEASPKAQPRSLPRSGVWEFNSFAVSTVDAKFTNH